MNTEIRICPTCNKEFQAKRKNKIYCSDTCRAEVNNEKLRDKIKSLKTLESKSNLGDKYKAAYSSAIRVVEIEYDQDKMSERLIFEGRNFKLYERTNFADKIGLHFSSNSIKGNKRIAIYFPKEGFLCFKQSSIGLHIDDNKLVTYMIEK